jgi:hypothetical protein
LGALNRNVPKQTTRVEQKKGKEILIEQNHNHLIKLNYLIHLL